MWQRFVIVFSIVMVGCVASLPADPGISADLATEAARMVLVLRQGSPPAPDAPAGQCENCKGTGKVRSGDGIEVFTCPVCEGTGKAAESVLHAAVFVPLVAEGSR
jgi:hypothetical protein